MPARINYEEAFRLLLDAVPVGQRLTFHDMATSPHLKGVGADTVKKHFKSFIDRNPTYLSSITGFYPKPETIIALVEQQIGPIAEANLDLANLESRKIVDGLAHPIVKQFIREGLSVWLDQEGRNIAIGIDVLTDFLIGDFSDFLRSAGNGLVSIAGSLNELLLVRALQNAGMENRTHFTRTGKGSQADIIIHSTAGARTNLSVEVKSYHARERLLRGLQDILVPKIGVGYFKDPAEFNPGRTRTLLQAQPAAIYMPRVTLDELSDESKNIKTTEAAAFESSLYRPLEQFVTDMKAFNTTGKLPKFP